LEGTKGVLYPNEYINQWHRWLFWGGDSGCRFGVQTMGEVFRNEKKKSFQNNNFDVNEVKCY
jgi:hypothetical protein